MRIIGLFICLMVIFGCEDEGAVDCSRFDATVNIVSEPGCTVGADVQVEASNGTEPYEYSLDGGDYGTENLFEDLILGSHTVIASDANECVFPVFFRLEAPGYEIAIEAISENNSGCTATDGQITISASGGVGTYQYSQLDGSFDTNNVFTDLAPGDYFFEAVDEMGCDASIAATVLEGEVSYANSISPILEEYCDGMNCHYNENSALSNWSDFSQVQANAQRIKETTSDRSMPDDGRELTQEEIDLIACWVDQGAMEN